MLFAPQTEHNPLIMSYNFASSPFAQPTMPRFDRRCCRRSCTGRRSSLPMQGDWFWTLAATLPNTSKCSLRCKSGFGKQLRHEGGAAVPLDRNTRFRASGRPGLVPEQENDVTLSRQRRLSWAEEGQLPLERALTDRSPVSPDRKFMPNSPQERFKIQRRRIQDVYRGYLVWRMK